MIFLLLLLATFGQMLAAADAGNLSGKWMLNIEKSDWGTKPRPEKVEIDIQHSEPAFKYSGSVTDANGAVTQFQFDGAIDGKSYKVKDGDATQDVTFKRVNAMTTASTINSADGKTTETTTTTLARDGKTLTRRILLKTADGTTRWTEVYDRVN